MSEDTLALLTRLTDYAQQSESAIAKVTQDVERMREERYKPYITTMGAFLALFMASIGYIYAMEQRLTDGFFEVQNVIGNLRSMEQINADRIAVTSDRLRARTSTMESRWDVHLKQHSQIDAGRQMMAQEILEMGRSLRSPQPE